MGRKRLAAPGVVAAMSERVRTVPLIAKWRKDFKRCEHKFYDGAGANRIAVLMGQARPGNPLCSLSLPCVHRCMYRKCPLLAAGGEEPR